LSEDKKELIVNETHDVNCKEEQKYYITTLLETQYQSIETIRLNQIINGELVNFKTYEVDPENDHTQPPAAAAEAAV
jgi:hypothetical protein